MNRVQSVIAIVGLFFISWLLHVFFCEWNGFQGGSGAILRFGDDLSLYPEMVSPAWAFVWGILTPILLVGSAFFLWAGRSKAQRIQGLSPATVETLLLDLSADHDSETRRFALRKLAMNGIAATTSPAMIKTLRKADKY